MTVGRSILRHGKGLSDRDGVLQAGAPNDGQVSGSPLGALHRENQCQIQVLIEGRLEGGAVSNRAARTG